MTPKQQRSLVRWIGDIAETLIPGWDLNIHIGDPGDPGDLGQPAAASVSCVWGRRIANMNVAPDIVKWRPEEQRHVIVHELIHVVFFGTKLLAERTFRDLVGSMTWDGYEPAAIKTDEDATDAMAKAIAPFFPLWEG